MLAENAHALGSTAPVSDFSVRHEGPADHDAVRRVHEAAFPGPEEANLVDVARAGADPVISLVAERSALGAGDDGVIGHILLSPVRVAGRAQPLRFGLAPVGVLPEAQGRGIGSGLIEAGIEGCRALGAVGVVLLGDPRYYARFGFVAASTFRLVYAPVGEHPAFQALELVPGGFVPGVVEYHSAFDRV